MRDSDSSPDQSTTQSTVVERLPEPLLRCHLEPVGEARALPVRLRRDYLPGPELGDLRRTRLDPAHGGLGWLYATLDASLTPNGVGPVQPIWGEAAKSF